MTIRTKHRVVGNLIGCNVNNPRSTAIHGLPAVFSPIEVKFMVQKGFVELRKSCGHENVHTEEIVQEYREFSERQLEEQRVILKRKKISELEMNLDKIVAGKRRKKPKSCTDDINPQRVLQDEIDKIPKLQKENLLIQTPTEYPFTRNYEVLQDVPLKQEDELKYKVFSHFCNMGKFLTSGSTFGGDFLVYPSDPLLVHASHVVHVLEKGDIDSKKFIAANRLCVGVKKTCIFAFEESPGKISCITTQWDGNYKPDGNKIT